MSEEATREINSRSAIYVFIDASNLWQAQKAKGRFFDYKKLADYIKNRFQGISIKVFYYTAYPADGTRDYATGDSDFLALVSYLRNGGKKVYIFSSKNNISKELRTGGDGYFDVLDIDGDIWGRELRHRAENG